PDWAQEISLALDMVSAACPGCHILLVEADSSFVDDVAAAERMAGGLGANAISNSFSVPESQFDAAPDDSAYRQTGVAITAAAGDTGYGAQFPADSPGLTAVGGTSLLRSTDARGWSET